MKPTTSLELFHLGASAVFGEHCPGAVTAALVYPPVVWLVMRASLREGLVQPWSALLAWLVAGVFHTWEVGHNVFRAW